MRLYRKLTTNWINKRKEPAHPLISKSRLLLTVIIKRKFYGESDKVQRSL
jgi:hypothetical protein